MFVIASIDAENLVILFIVALVVFGPKRLPEVGRQVGLALRDLRKLSQEFTNTLMGVHEEVRSSIAPSVSGVLDQVKPISDVRFPPDVEQEPSPADADPMASKSEFGEEEPPHARRGVTLSTLPPDGKGEA